MNSFELRSKRDAEEALANLLLQSAGSLENFRPINIDVSEDNCFNNKWISVGQITLFPEPANASLQEVEADKKRLLTALRYGFYDWKIPIQKQLIENITNVIKNNKNQESKNRKIIESTKAIVHAAMRCGLAQPVFDAISLSRMPFRRPVSIVVDTNAVLQGGLDFIARHLAPQARIKVPALVHMEILNFVDRYFEQRRKMSNSAGMLLDHLCSQGGQRVLLRLETNQKIEFERPRLGADPLRGVVQVDSDAEDKRLGLQKVQRSFADRLILETAVQHRDKVGPDHPVMLLTSDQGLARMALAEGIEPIFVDSNAISYVFGSTFSGINFVPFIKDGSRFYYCPVSDLLWELATTFGSARLTCDHIGISFEVVSLGEGVSWQPYHSYEDLLWTRSISQNKPNKSLDQDLVTKSSKVSASTNSPQASPIKRRRMGTYSFNLNIMFRLIAELSDVGSLTDDLAKELLNVKSDSSYGEYYNFLTAGQFVKRKSGVLLKEEALDDLFQGIRNYDYGNITNLLSNVASFQQFLEKLAVGNGLSQEASQLRADAFRTYSNLAELCCKGIRFVERGTYGTPNNPTPAKFVEPALEAYNKVRAGESFALTGEWLEYLAEFSGIHPICTRQRLAEAHQGGYLQRFFEGSTPDTRFENRNIQVLEIIQGRPTIRTANLYHGDFLLAGRASVSIKIAIGDGK